MLQEPWTYFSNLHLDDVEALYDDIKEYAVGWAPGNCAASCWGRTL